MNSASSGRVGQSSGNLQPSPTSKSKPGRSKTCLMNCIGCGLWISLKKTLTMPSSAQVEIKLHLKDGQTSELKIADPDQAKKQAIAASSEIEGPVLVASHILDSIPRSVVSLADRSLISAEAADIREITWKTDNGGGNLVWMDENSWGTKEGAAAPKAVENPWTVRSFLAHMENVEYIEAVEPAPTLRKGRPIRSSSWMSLGKRVRLPGTHLPPTMQTL